MEILAHAVTYDITVHFTTAKEMKRYVYAYNTMSHIVVPELDNREFLIQSLGLYGGKGFCKMKLLLTAE